jgi:mono/diheme cytochrome c family protein
MVGSRSQRKKRLIAFGLAVLAPCLFFVGCNLEPEPYSNDMTYLQRTDPLVVGIPESQPTFMDPPGKLDEMPLLIKEKAGKVLMPSELKPKERSQLDAALTKAFGKPAHPKVKGKYPDSEDDIDADSKLALDEKTLARGSILYRQHCLHCHGLNGDGHGPTASWVVPHPRDYRPGKFKFSSSSQGTGSRKPLREDLIRTLKQGLEGTSMPSFGLLPREDLEALVSYVIHLSLRGQVEFDTIQTLMQENPLEGDTIEEHVNDRIGKFANQWREADTKLIKPLSTPTYNDKQLAESVQRGYKLFIEQGAAGCVSCHKDFGRKNEYRYDEWGTIVRPINLTKGEYRGGRRPLDFYWRIHSGINGTGMPSFGDLLTVTKPDGTKDDSKLWDLINFLQVLPYPKMLDKYGIKLDTIPASESADKK